jgi:hypothetical protein
VALKSGDDVAACRRKLLALGSQVWFLHCLSIYTILTSALAYSSRLNCRHGVFNGLHLFFSKPPAHHVSLCTSSVCARACVCVCFCFCLLAAHDLTPRQHFRYASLPPAHTRTCSRRCYKHNSGRCAPRDIARGARARARRARQHSRPGRVQTVRAARRRYCAVFLLVNS